MPNIAKVEIQEGRRAFLRDGSLLLLGAACLGGCNSRNPELPTDETAKTSPLKFSLITDLHYADKAKAGSRYYRQTIEKLREAINQFQIEQPQFIVALGDLIDSADDLQAEKAHLATVHAMLAEAPGEKHFVLGNHCVSGLTKTEFLDQVGQQKSSYSFDREGYHFIVLDACFRSDGEPYGRNNFDWTDAKIPDEQLDWLEKDLAADTSTTVVFAHQRLDPTESHSVKNASEVRQILQRSGRVHSVFQGHSHKNNHCVIEDIHYCVLSAMVEGKGLENNGFCHVEMLQNDTLKLTGFHRQSSYRWPI